MKIYKEVIKKQLITLIEGFQTNTVEAADLTFPQADFYTLWLDHSRQWGLDKADILLLIAAVTVTVVLVVSYDFSVPM